MIKAEQVPPAVKDAFYNAYWREEATDEEAIAAAINAWEGGHQANAVDGSQHFMLPLTETQNGPHYMAPSRRAGAAVAVRDCFALADRQVPLISAAITQESGNERMTDAEVADLIIPLVGRHGYADALSRKSHAEITRLRAEVNAHNHAEVKLLVEIDELRAEVERLKAIETEFWQQNSDLGKALLENEKLRAALEAIANCQPKEDHNCNTNDLVACRVVNLARAALGDTP